jgi:cytochrome c peroxidase
MTFAHASNAMAGFIVQEFAFNNSPWDRFLAGDDGALTSQQLLGARDFMSARCSICHTGAAFTDLQFHNVALAQLGPGEGDGPLHDDDFGHERVSHEAADRYRFRTTPLRNVELTGPYGHAGEFVSLRDFVSHYSQSDRKLLGYVVNQLEPALRPTVRPTFAQILARRDSLLSGVSFPESVIDELTAFMRALTDPAARDLRRVIPDRVPSGLPLNR